MLLELSAQSPKVGGNGLCRSLWICVTREIVAGEGGSAPVAGQERGETEPMLDQFGVWVL